MQTNYKHICVCLCPFVFSPGSVSVGTLNQAVIWYLFGKMSIDIFEVIESSVPSDYYRTLHYVYGIVILFALYFKTCIMWLAEL